MHEITTCNLCGSNKLICVFKKNIEHSEPWSSFISSDLFPVRFHSNLCLKCGWIFQNPVYDDEELEKLYKFSSLGSSEESRSMATLNAEKRGNQLFFSLQKWLNSSSKYILDVGGRNGELMKPFIFHGFNVSVLDMDGGKPVDHSIKKIRLPFLKHSREVYDLITMIHVLEHVESPRDFLAHAHSLINEDGLIYIEVPSELITPMIFRHVGDHRHLGYFSRQTLRAFLESNGFICLSCTLEIGLVGSSLPVLRAVAKKSDKVTWKPSRFMMIRSLAEVIHPLPLIVRLSNKLKSLTKEVYA